MTGSGAITVKICGLSTEATLDAAIEAGADMVGLVFFPKSPRFISLETATTLAAQARGRAEIVALTVDMDDAALGQLIAAVKPDFLQLHGKETPERVDSIRDSFGVPVVKALHIATADDLLAADAYEFVADRLLLDAKPPKGAVLPGGNGAAFDWTLLADFDPPLPYFLSGGLDPKNVADAIRVSGATAVDVSSGLETSPGVKSADLIRAFIAAARAAGIRNSSERIAS